MTNNITVRPATEADQPTIRRIIHQAGINPTGLDWRRFLLAVEGEQVIGTGQIKPHNDGSHELASIAVIPARQKRGIGSMIIRALLESERGALHLTCQRRMAGYYERFGFRRIERAEYPPYFVTWDRTIGLISRIIAVILRKPVYLIVMRRDGANPYLTLREPHAAPHRLAFLDRPDMAYSLISAQRSPFAVARLRPIRYTTPVYVWQSRPLHT